MKNKFFTKLHTKFHKKFDSGMKNLDLHDLAFTKLSVIFAILFLLTVWPSFSEIMLGVPCGWYFLAAIIFAARPLIHFFKCCKK